MTFSTAVFYALSLLTLASALGVVLLRNTLHSALLLGLSLLGVAGLFATLGADFLFASQILVYVGGVALLMLFVVLLAGRSGELRLRQVNDMWMGALLVCAFIFWALRRFSVPYLGLKASSPALPTTAGLGRLLLRDLAVPFELVSVLLIAALAGAVIFSKAEKRR
jgi:NADH-quinone oxidoreductase subunit J